MINDMRSTVPASALHRRSGLRHVAETPRPDAAELATFGELIARDGYADHEPAVLELACAAQGHGVSAVVIGVLADDRAPSVARDRALATVMSQLTRYR